jgi:hypothetical protein
MNFIGEKRGRERFKEVSIRKDTGDVNGGSTT